ncbi:hypothetical protein EDD37DRAFT_607121 [Exophiala viscosa]|uniref:uncharacterized protein n=1 Tax=Exophiala viscosa TaxID=2486360 RepID=UPI0021901D9D|nr:hypothetical protein EDD37DRAFT_607121 [Exophiala viscosa]
MLQAQHRCKERGGAPIPEGQSKGRKRSSCLSCVKLRTRCDQETPCTRCQELGKECVRVSSPQKGADSIRPKSRDAIPIQHLLNNPGGDDFIAHFPIRDALDTPVGEDDNFNTFEAEDSSDTEHLSEEYERNDVFIGADMPAFEAAINFENFDSYWSIFPNMVYPPYPQPEQSPPASAGGLSGVTSHTAMTLEPVAYQVRELLIATAHKLATETAQNLPLLIQDINLLTNIELDNSLNLYFANYHRHCPILHRQSFHPTTVPTPLLLATVALGAMYSRPSTVQWMKRLLDVMEAYTFSFPGLRDEYGAFSLSDAADEETLEYQFQLFQGAYLMVVAQFFSGTLAARRRARRQRFTTVLGVARSFKLPKSQHSSIVSIPDELSFQHWIRKEVRIRTMNIMLALDSAMGFFYNVAPRINYSELDLQLPCHPEYFELSSYAEMLTKSLFPRTRIKIIDAFQPLFYSPQSLAAAFQNETLCYWDMLLLVHVLYTHCWQHLFGNPLNRLSPTTLAPGPAEILEPIKNCIDNWKTLWDEVRARPPSNVAESGFETTADSYWTLIKLIVQKFEIESAPQTAGGNEAELRAIDSFLNGMSNGGDGAAPTCDGVPQVSIFRGLDFMPIEADCDVQGAHLRKILFGR